MNLGFLVRCDKLGVAFHQVGEASSLLSTAADEVCRVVFLGRLYYGEDLRRRLAGTHRPEPTDDAAAHVLAAYRQGGVAGLEWLEGDYAFALWDMRERRLLAARDPFGGFPLFWVRDGDGVALGTAMRPLLDLLPQRTVDREYLAEFLVLPGGSVQELHDERCAYEGVHRVLAGERVEVRPEGTVRATCWWDWQVRREEPAGLRHEDLAGRFGALLRDAVRQRMVGRTAAHLSGGMDSTAVALLAAWSAREAGSEPVHGLSLVYERLGLLSRERPYIDSAYGAPGLHAHRIVADDYLSYDSFLDDSNPDEPAPSLCLSSSSRALLERAADLGAQTVMTGLGADDLVCLMPWHLCDLLRAGRWLEAWAESSCLADAHRISRWRFLGPFGLIPFLPASLRGGLSCWRRQGRVPLERQREYTIGPWMRPEFAQRYGMWPRIVARQRRMYHRCRPLALSVALEGTELNVGDGIRWELAAPRGMMTVHPYRDPRLVRFCLGFEGKVRGDPARPKALLADAMRDVLPAAIRERSRKGNFNEVVFRGLARNLPRLEALVRQAPVDDFDLLDKEELLRCLRQAALGLGDSAPGLDRLNLTLCLLKWLTTQQEVRRRSGPTLRPLEAPMVSRPAVKIGQGRQGGTAASGVGLQAPGDATR